MKNKTYCLFLLFALLPASWANSAELTILLAEPQWILDDVPSPLSEREALLQPREESVTDLLWPMLAEENYAEAVELIITLVPLDFENPYTFISPALNHVLGQVYSRMGEYDLAEESYLIAIGQLPDFIRAHQSLGLLYIRTERFDEARVHVSKAAELGGVNAALYRYLGYLNFKDNNPWGEASAYQLALMLDNDHLQTQQGMLHGLIYSGQNSSALSFVNKMLMDNPNDSDLWLNKAQISLQMDDLETAMTSLELAIGLGNDSAANLQTCAQLHLQVGSISRAIDLFKASFYEGIDFRYMDQTLTWLTQREQWDYSADLLDRINEDIDSFSDLEKSQLLHHEAKIHLHNEQNEDALETLQQSIALDPGNALALIQLASLYSDIDRYAEAEMLFIRAKSYEDVKETAMFAHAQMAIEMVDYPTALKILRELTVIYPERFDIKQNIEVLENLIRNRQEAF